jgi:hypothetical protein
LPRRPGALLCSQARDKQLDRWGTQAANFRTEVTAGSETASTLLSAANSKAVGHVKNIRPKFTAEAISAIMKPRAGELVSLRTAAAVVLAEKGA